MIRGREGLSSAALKYMRFMEAEKELPGKINDATVVLRRHDEEESFQDQSSIVSNSSDVEMCSPDDDEDYQRSFQEIMSQHDISLQSNTSFNEENETIAENIKNFHAFETSIEEIFQGISKTPEYEPENEFTCGGFTEVSVTSSQNNNMFKSPPPKRQRLRNFTINPSMLTQDVFNISSKFNSFHDNLESEANFSKFPIHSEALETFNNSQTQFPESSIEKDPTESFIDESMMPERCRTNELEQTIMQNGKLNVSTFYSSQVVRNSNKVIDSYYKVHQFQDWNAIAGEMLEKFEPSLDYLYDKFDLPKSVQLGDENQEIGGEIELEDIRESLKEIEDSFDGLEASFVSSTPTKPNKSCDLLKKSMGINEVTGKQVTNFTEMNHSEKIVAYKSLEIIEKARKNNSNLRATEENDENCNGSQENVKNFNDFKKNAENAENLQINLSEEFLEIPEKIQENIKESEKTANKAKKSSNQNTETSQNFQTTSQNTKKKSLKIKTRISQRLIKKRNLISQQQIKSVSDIFADITCTQKTATPEIGAFDLSFVHLLNREENRNNESIIASQEPLMDPDFLEVLHAENPIEALQALTQQNPVLANARCAAILTQIEKIFHSLLESLVQQKPLLLKIQTVRSWKDCEMNNEILSNKEVNVTKCISFGNKNTEKSFAVMVVLMCEIYKMLSQGSSCTKRELYYRDVELFGNQETVNRAVNNLCAMLNVQEFELAVMSSSKGLVAGDLTIVIGDEKINCKTPRAVPQNPSEISSFETAAEFVLVVEKDTVFQRLVNDEIFKKDASKIILITGKGYPDINTRMLLKKISTDSSLPIYIIVDADPHGIEIMCTYKYGSMHMVHNSEHLAVPSIKWIGIHPSDIENLDVAKVNLTEADMKKVDELLERPYIDRQLMRELNYFKTMPFKAEIESLYHFSTDFLINDYIPKKIRLIEMPPTQMIEIEMNLL